MNIRNKCSFLGSKSGRDSEKMKEVELTSIQTPSGDMSFKEARLIIECKLTAITTPNPNDFYSQESKDYINEAYKDANDYRKYGIWGNYPCLDKEIRINRLSYKLSNSRNLLLTLTNGTVNLRYLNRLNT